MEETSDTALSSNDHVPSEGSKEEISVSKVASGIDKEIEETQTGNSDDDDGPIVSRQRFSRSFHLLDSDDDSSSTVTPKVLQSNKIYDDSGETSTSEPNVDIILKEDQRTKLVNGENSNFSSFGVDEVLDEPKATNQDSGTAPSWKSNLNGDLYSDGDSSGAEESVSIENIKLNAKRKLKLAEKTQNAERRSSSKKRETTHGSKDKLQEIHSETQRLARSAAVSLPYHRPKQRSLVEFLNRKRVTPRSEEVRKPRLIDYDSVVQVLEERAKEAETFFKSDSEESDGENDNISGMLTHGGSKTTEQDGEVASTAHPVSKEADVEPTVSGELRRKASSVTLFEENARVTFEDQDSRPTGYSCDSVEEKPDESLSSLEDSKGTKTVPQTTDISSEYPADFSKLSYNHKEKIDYAKRLSITKVSVPTLQGRPGQLLTLDDGVSTTPDHKVKVNNLIERFVEQVKTCSKIQSPQKKELEISIVKKVMGDDGKVELTSDVVKVSVGSDRDGPSLDAVGRRQLLKDSLQKSISAKRAERMNSNQSGNQKEVGNFGEEEMSESGEEALSEYSDTDIEKEEYSLDGDEGTRKKRCSMYFADEADDSDMDHSGDEDIEKMDDMERAEEDTSSSTELDDGDDFIKDKEQPSLSKVTMTSKESGHYSSLENLTPNLNASDPEDNSKRVLMPGLPASQVSSEGNFDELLALCTGKFTDTKEEGGPSRNLFGKSTYDSEDDEEDLEDKGFSRIIPTQGDDEDDMESKLKLVESETENEPKIAPTFLENEDDEGKSRSKRGKIGRLLISDDEEEDAGKQSADEEEEMHEEEREFRGMNEFFEDEAELSGSEVGSGDEREDDVDDWEEEEGDKEDLDENEIREQVERAHFKTLLDQDQRDVRLFQELFLEDGDLHADGGGRQRQFRWKNADSEESDGLSLRARNQDDEDEQNAEEQDDITWRKMRSEREKWLQKQNSKEEEAEIPVIRRNGKLVKVAKKVTKSSAASEANPEISVSVNPALSSPPKKTTTSNTVRRGSFLRRSDKDLTAIASLTKSVLPVQAPKNANNFVFASVTPERPNAASSNRKQKLEESKGDSSNPKPPPTKKAKSSLSSKSIFSYL